VDLTRDWDLMEEVARLEGYDNIPVTIPPIRPSDEKESSEMATGDRVREIMVGLGFSEMISFSFIAPDSADFLGAEKESPVRSFVTLLNPLTVDQSVMRTSLIPGLLAAVKTNLSYGEKDLKLFEWEESSSGRSLKIFRRKGTCALGPDHGAGQSQGMVPGGKSCGLL
jgi:phenylalanyl-tRNA synthetase beta chain